MRTYSKQLPYFIFFVTFVSTAASIYFSEVMKLTPCMLCWYQRMMMFPLVIISGVAIIRKDLQNLAAYVLPIAIIGWGIALYHNLLYYHVIPELTPCMAGISCTTELIKLFGFMDIPLGSFISFTIIIVCTIIYSIVIQSKVAKS